MAVAPISASSMALGCFTPTAVAKVVFLSLLRGITRCETIQNFLAYLNTKNEMSLIGKRKVRLEISLREFFVCL